MSGYGSDYPSERSPPLKDNIRVSAPKNFCGTRVMSLIPVLFSDDTYTPTRGIHTKLHSVVVGKELVRLVPWALLQSQ